jgi:hypothetical protein
MVSSEGFSGSAMDAFDTMRRDEEGVADAIESDCDGNIILESATMSIK